MVKSYQSGAGEKSLFGYFLGTEVVLQMVSAMAKSTPGNRAQQTSGSVQDSSTSTALSSIRVYAVAIGGWLCNLKHNLLHVPARAQAAMQNY